MAGPDRPSDDDTGADAGDLLAQGPADEEARKGPNRLLVAVISGVVLAGLVALFAYGLMNREPLTGASGMERPGDPAPPFSLATLDGESAVNLEDYAGRPVVVNFWASWCAPCRVEMPHFVDAFHAYGGGEDGVVFIGIDVQDSPSDAQQFAEDFEVPVDEGFILVRDNTGSTTIAYGVSGLPATFFIDPDGTVAARWVGAVDREVIDKNIALISA